MTFRAQGRPLGLRGAGLGAVIAMATTLSVSGPACDTLLVGGLQVGGVCENGATRCADDTPETCRAGAWDPGAPCEAGKRCRAGVCIVDCNPGDLRCFGNTPQTCVDGVWTSQDPCEHQTCILGACAGECALGDAACSGKTPQVCDTAGKWQNLPDCSGECVKGSCPGPSCAGLEENCGPNKDESCCLSPVVPGGSFFRGNDQRYPATVSEFRLDRFEITVGRYAAFLAATGGTPPAPGAGARPGIPDSGWSSDWDNQLAADKATLKCSNNSSSWLSNPVGYNASRPADCLRWYEVFAFCVWDGGWLPTEAEWEYAAAGGGEQRKFPWGDAVPASDLALCGHESGSVSDIVQVGSTSPAGDGKWGHADLAGSMTEWNLDVLARSDGSYTYEMCTDCADTRFKDYFPVIHDGGWNESVMKLGTYNRRAAPGDTRADNLGGRCARPR